MTNIPTTVIFHGYKEGFESQKEAFIWFVENILNEYPEILKNPFITDGRYLARSPQEITRKIDNHYECRRIRIWPLSSGETWYLNLKLDNVDKERILSMMTKEAGLGVKGSNWDWYNSSPKQSKPKRRTLKQQIADLV